MSDIEDLYRDAVLQRSRAPLFAQAPAGANAEGIGDNPMCGDHVRLFLRREADGTIAAAGHAAEGCAINLAAADLLAGAVAGRTGAEALQIRDAFAHMIETGQENPSLGALQAFAGLHAYPARRRCATLPFQALAAALGEHA